MTGNLSACRVFASQWMAWFTGFLALLLNLPHTVARAEEPVEIRPAQRASAGSSSEFIGEKSFLVEWIDARRNRTVPARIYVPPKGDHWPIIIFSHGLGGTRNGYSHYGNHWSQNGFLCVHLEHEGSDGDVLQKGAGLQNMKKLEAAAADPRNALNRARDVTFAIDQIIAAQQHGGEGDLDSIKGKLNTERMGMAGHSFGANTTMLICGMQSGNRQQSMESLGDQRIIAAIAMSIPVNRIDSDVLDRMYGEIKVPILHLTGTNDSSPIDIQGPEARQLPFEHCRQPDQIMIVFTDGDHAVFAATPGVTNARSKLMSRIRPPAKNYATIQPIVMETTTHFWKKWLLDDATSENWLKSDLTGRVADAGVVKYKSPK